MIQEFIESYKNEDERLKMKQFFIDNLYKIDKSKKTIIFSTPSETGTSHFRCLEPLRAIYKKYPNKYNYIYTEKFTVDMLNIADLIIQHRAGDMHSRMLEAIKATMYRNHNKIIHDVDDNEVNVPKSNPLHEMWYAAGKDKMASYQLTNSDYCTTTTNQMKKFMSKFNAESNIKIFRNMFDWNLPQWNLKQDWLEQKNKEGKIVIGWAGLTSHFQDIKKMKKMLKKIHDKYPNTYFILAGMPYKNTASSIKIDPNTGNKIFEEVEVTDEQLTYKYKVKQEYKDFDPNRIEFLDVLSLAEYGKFYSMFNIGIAYTENINFNHKKSEIKIIEYMRYGAIPLFSYMGGYKDVFDMLPNDYKDNNYRIIADNMYEWERKLSYILDNYEKYSNLAKTHLMNFVLNNYDINKDVDNRINFYEELMKR